MGCASVLKIHPPDSTTHSPKGVLTTCSLCLWIISLSTSKSKYMYLVVSDKKKDSIRSSNVWSRTSLTVAYPQGVLALYSILSSISSPRLSKNGSLVALYKYMADSINSGLKGYPAKNYEKIYYISRVLEGTRIMFREILLIKNPVAISQKKISWN